jgi:pimeloyl-ACP methyl ester carboxylesterase
MQHGGGPVQAGASAFQHMADVSFFSLSAAEIFTVATPDGAVLPVYGVGGPARAPGLLVAHANGLAAGSYGPWLAELTGDFRVFAFDARGHGGAAWPEGSLEAVFHVDRFADDLALVGAAVAARLGGAALLFAGHSLGAAAALRLAARGGAPPWRASLLFEPPIFPPPTSPHFAAASPEQLQLIERSAQRRARWESPDALAHVLAARGMFRRFRADLLAAHCRATLKALEDGGYALACPPEVESSIFRSHRGSDTWARLPAVRTPIHLVGGDPALPERGWVSLVMPEMAAQIPGARLSTIRGAGHMMIFEEPERCRQLVLEEMEFLA